MQLIYNQIFFMRFNCDSINFYPHSPYRKRSAAIYPAHRTPIIWRCVLSARSQ